MAIAGTGHGTAASTRFPYLLKTLREAAGLTQEDLAARSGVSSRAISDMERDRVVRPQVRTLQALGSVLAPEGSAASAEFLRRGRAKAAAAPPRPQRCPSGGRPEPPPEIADLTGRERELREVLAAAGRARGARAATVITVSGPPGVGKSAFLVHAAHRLAPRFPDGCVHLGLGGRNSAQALGVLLSALGVPDDELPTRFEARASRYRSLLRDRKLLLVFDDVVEEGQVRPLLPSNPDCVVLISGPRQLTGLESVARTALEQLRPAESERLLSSIAGARRISAEPEATAALAELCDHLPLALRIAGNQLAARPGARVEQLARRLAAPHRRLAALTAGDLQMRETFEASCRRCTEPALHVFRRLSLAGNGEIAIGQAAVLAEVDVDTAERALDELAEVGLLTAEADGRYRLRELTGLFAGERLRAAEPYFRVDQPVGTLRRCPSVPAGLPTTALRTGRFS